MAEPVATAALRVAVPAGLVPRLEGAPPRNLPRDGFPAVDRRERVVTDPARCARGPGAGA